MFNSTALARIESALQTISQRLDALDSKLEFPQAQQAQQAEPTKPVAKHFPESKFKLVMRDVITLLEAAKSISFEQVKDIIESHQSSAGTPSRTQTVIERMLRSRLIKRVKRNHYILTNKNA